MKIENLSFLFRFRLSTLLFVCISLLALGCSASAEVERVLGAEVIPDAFSSLYQEVSSGSDIPMLLPTSLPDEALREVAPGQEQPFFTSTDLVEKSAYEANLDVTADCEGAGYCTFGILGAERITPQTESIDEMYAYYLDPSYQPTMRSEEPIAEVQLADGITGTFIPWVCGANCNTAKVYWEESGIRYYVGIRMADMNTVVAIANSMIENQPHATADDADQ
jgi:hypothetical protein